MHLDPAPGHTDERPEPRILVVDDNLVNRHLLVALLERGGFRHVATADDGVDALNRVETFQPDLLLLDLMMPQMDGFEVCRRLRTDPRWRETPVLVQSSLNRAEDRARAFAAGATDYVTKPVNAVEFLARVRIHLHNRALLSDLRTFRQRTESELALAHAMQARLMPSPERLEGLCAAMGIVIDAHFAPSSELGGDFWGIRPAGTDRLIVYLIDFSGHGVGAALNTFRLHAILQQIDMVAMDPPAVLGEVNRRLCTLLPGGQFATMLVGVLDLAAGRFDYASAGSTRPMTWMPGDGAPAFGDSAGLPLGLLPGASYDARYLPFPPGARLFLYSDAAIEIPHGADVLDDVGLAALVAGRLAAQVGTGFTDAVAVDLAAIGPIDDDLTLLLIARPVR